MTSRIPKSLRKCLFLSSILVIQACGEDSSSDEKSADRGEPITKKSEILGSWSMKEAVFEDNEDQSVVISGINILSFRANGTLVMEKTAYSSEYAGEYSSNKCTNFVSSKFDIDNGKIVQTDAIQGDISGKCSEGESPSLLVAPDISSKVSTDGETLYISSDFTYLGEDGGSKKETLTTIWTKKSDEDWDGNGLDPRFEGTWLATKAYGERFCDSSEPDRGELSISGSFTLSIDGTTYTETANNFLSECTGTASGKISSGKLANEYTQESASVDCMKDAPLAAGETILAERQFVTESGKLIDFYSKATSTDDCYYQDREVMNLIGVMEKK